MVLGKMVLGNLLDNKSRAIDWFISTVNDVLLQKTSTLHVGSMLAGCISLSTSLCTSTFVAS